MSSRKPKPVAAKSEAKDLPSQWLTKLRNIPVVAALIVVAAIVTAASGFWVALPEGLKKAVSAYIDHPVKLPGETGWIFVGYFLQEDRSFIEGPYVAIMSSNSRGRTRFVEIGDIVRIIKSPRRVYMVNFKSQGAAKKFVSPIERGVISDDDQTSVTLPIGAELIVRDVSEGAWPGNPRAAIWARIVLASGPNPE